MSFILIYSDFYKMLAGWILTDHTIVSILLLSSYWCVTLFQHVGWWSPTILRGDDREAIHIPNHKFTMNVVRNLSQKTHWRIKTHIAISHLDVNKINVSDLDSFICQQCLVQQQACLQFLHVVKYLSSLVLAEYCS